MSRNLPLRVSAALYGGAAAVVLAVVVAAVTMIWQMRESALADTEGQATRFASGAEAAINRSLVGADVLLASLGALLGDRTVEQAQGEAMRGRISTVMREMARQSLLVRQFALVRADGHVLAPATAQGMATPLELPEGFVREVLAQPVSSLQVSEPRVSPVSSQRVLYLARALVLHDGTRLVAVAEVPVSTFTTILTQGADIAGLEVTLERSGGAVLASMPPRDDPAVRAARRPLDEREADGHPKFMASRLTGVPAVVVYRPTLHRNLLVVAGIPLGVALADWQVRRDFIIGVAIMLVLMVLAVAAFALHQLRRQWWHRANLQRSKATLDQALDAMSDGFVLLDAQGRAQVWNPRLLDLFPGVEPLVGSAAVFQLPGDDPARTAGGAVGLADGEHELRLADGRRIVAMRSPTPDGGQVCVFRDVTERLRQIAEVVEGRAQLQATLDAVPDAMLEMGLDGLCHRYHPPRTASGTAPFPGDPVGRTLAELFAPDAAGQLMNALREAYQHGLSAGQQIERRAEHGTAWFELSVSRMDVGEGQDARFIVMLRDITEHKAAAQEIEHLAFYDTLTGLPNRRLLLHRLQAVVENNAHRGRQGALLFLDLDHFKTLNDAQGQAMGDVLLRQVADRLRALLGVGDTVARLGGDEFVILVDNLGIDPVRAAVQTQAFGEGVLADLGRPYQLGSYTYHGTTSIGATVFGDRSQSLDELLKQADIAMFHAKQAGGNGLRFFEAPMQTTITARATLENELHAALKGHQFTLHYQRQVAAAGEITGAEVLIRWRHPHRGLIPPAAFIDVAEGTGLIVPIGIWVLEQACRQLEQWSHHPRRRHLQLAVNVSARQFQREDFADQVREVFIRTGAEPSRLKIELTESLLQDKVEETIRKMKSLAAIGIRFAMDDFGTGYSSLSYMAQLPLHQVKIDKFFVGGIGSSPKLELLIQTIIGMARSLDLEVVAEGVETPEQLAFLERHGCRLFQGYLFGRPLDIEELERELDVELVSPG
ncbi:putative signaling protein [Xylophilus ampelinus]|nr:EAL domain-containing protein [Variovorax sp.]VTY26363.1 putative signaling protein [Xylophilus ampelinus]